MMWLVMGAGFVRKPGAATLVAAVQAIMVISLGTFGTHGLMSFFTYLMPGIAVDLVMLLSRHKGCCIGCCFAGGIAANITGTYLVNLVFFRLPFIPLVLSLASASLSGGLGGVIAYSLIRQVENSSLSSILRRRE